MLAEILLSRLFDNYLVYLSDLTALILETDPAIIKNESSGYTLPLNFVFKYPDHEDLIRAVAEKRITELSLYGMDGLVDYFNDKLKLKLFYSKKDLDEVTLLKDFRNLIVHNRGIVDEKFHKTHNNYVLGQQIEFTIGMVNTYLPLINSSVLKLDKEAIKKYSLANS